MEQEPLSTCWLNQKSTDIEIDSSYEIVAIGDFFAQGQDATAIINEIAMLWEANPHLNNEEVVRLWACNNLY